MRFKSAYMIALFLIIASFAVMTVNSADYDATIFVDPPLVIDDTMTAGDKFNATIKISDVEDCYSWTLNISWDPAVLTMVNLYPYPDPSPFLAGQPEGTSYYLRFEVGDGWGFISETTDGVNEGVDGNGTLAIFEFQVVGYGYCDINIDDPETYVMVYPPYPPIREEVNKENGFFNNAKPGDVDADGDVDFDDFIVLAGAYGSSSGDPGYDERADFDRDGDVDFDDFITLAGNYGT